MLREKKYYVVFDDYEQGYILRVLNNERTKLINENKNSDIVDDLIIKIGTAPLKKVKVIERNYQNETR